MNYGEDELSIVQGAVDHFGKYPHLHLCQEVDEKIDSTLISVK